jgi:hypothetical protein
MLSHSGSSIITSLVLGVLVPLAISPAPLLGQISPEVGTQIEIKAPAFDIPRAKDVAKDMATVVAKRGQEMFGFLKWVEAYRTNPNNVLKISLEGTDDVYLKFTGESVDGSVRDFHQLLFSNAAERLTLDQVKRRLVDRIAKEFQNDDFLGKVQSKLLGRISIASDAVLLGQPWVGIPLPEAGLGIQEESEILVSVNCALKKSCIADFRLHVVTGGHKERQEQWAKRVQGRIFEHRFLWEGDDWDKHWDPQISKVFKTRTSVKVYVTKYLPNSTGKQTIP